MFSSTQQLSPFKTLIIISFSFALLSCSSNNDPKEVALNYADAVYSGSVSQFKKLVEEKDHQSTDDYKFFVQEKSSGRYKTALRRDGIASIEVMKSSVGKKTAKIKLMVEFKNNTKKTISISLHKKDDNWYVNPMNWASW